MRPAWRWFHASMRRTHSSLFRNWDNCLRTGSVWFCGLRPLLFRPVLQNQSESPRYEGRPFGDAQGKPELQGPWLTLPALFPCNGMCYNRPAVERAAKTPSGPARSQRGEFSAQQLVPPQGEPARAQEAHQAGPHEDVSRYCPVCSQRLEARRCKLVCRVCGYYMSCADYY